MEAIHDQKHQHTNQQPEDRDQNNKEIVPPTSNNDNYYTTQSGRAVIPITQLDM